MNIALIILCAILLAISTTFYVWMVKCMKGWKK